MVVLPFEPAWTEVPSVKTVIRAQMNIDNLFIAFVLGFQFSISFNVGRRCSLLMLFTKAPLPRTFFAH